MAIKVKYDQTIYPWLEVSPPVDPHQEPVLNSPLFDGFLFLHSFRVSLTGFYPHGSCVRALGSTDEKKDSKGFSFLVDPGTGSIHNSLHSPLNQNSQQAR